MLPHFQALEILDALAAHVVVLDGDGIIVATNKSWRAFGQRLGLGDGWDGVGENYLAVCDAATGFASEGAAEVGQGIRDVIAGRRDIFSLEYPCHDAQEERWFVCRVTRLVVEKAYVAIAHENVTDVKLAEGRLREQQELNRLVLEQSLKEKETLLKEIHHRVKNNLQVVSSLLDLQISFDENPKVQEPLRESMSRVRSMALIHEQLYQNNTFVSINLGNYAEDLANALFRSYGTGQNIKLVVETDPIEVNMETAIPCGLILNELISNAFKHAFVQKTSGQLVVRVGNEDKDTYQLIVQDDGGGLPDGIVSGQASTLGLQLVERLVRQLKGHLTVENRNGAFFSLTFKALVSGSGGMENA